MRVLEAGVLRGPNLHAPHGVVRLVVALDASPTADGTRRLGERLLEALPALRDEACDEAADATFGACLAAGDSLAHVVAHVAPALQRRVGVRVEGAGTVSPAGPGEAVVVFPYDDEETGLAAGRAAVDLVDALAAGRAVDVDAVARRLRAVRDEHGPGPGAEAIIAEARRRGIPAFVDAEAGHLRLGQGARQRRLQSTITDATSLLSVEIADDKARTKGILARAGIPVPRGFEANDLEAALAAARELGYPVVVKPVVGNHGRGITTDIRTAEALAAAFRLAKDVHRTVVVEKFLQGKDFRLLVVDHKLVAAARRDPAHVVGDGRHSIRELVDIVNDDPTRGEGHEKSLTRITLDKASRMLLAEHGLTPESVPPEGMVVPLKGPANISSGGTATDVTDEIHPQVRRMVERASRVIGMDVMGLDIVAPTLSRPLDEVGGGVVEVNASPGLRMHLAPSYGRPRDVAAAIVDMLFPDGDGRIPLVAVTGTNGKTTTTRLVAHILREALGATVGLSSTTGVEIDGECVAAGDYSGPGGAALVLQDASVDHAVLEVARGGILRRGLGFDECDVGVLLNVSADHLGEHGVDTVEQLAEVKALVVKHVRPGGAAVLNADDPLVARYRKALRAKVVLFSLQAESEVVREHVAQGGKTFVLSEGALVLRDAAGDERLVEAREVPIAMGGVAAFNVANALAACAAAHALGVPARAAAAALRTFRPTPEQLPGRLNLLEAGPYRVLVDYGHNVAALRAIAPVVEHLSRGRVVAVSSAAGNRRAEDIIAFGREAASMYDEVIVCDPDPRGRGAGETSELVMRGARESGEAAPRVRFTSDERDAIRLALSLAQPDDLVVIQADDVQGTLRVLDELLPGRGGADGPGAATGRAPPPAQGTLQETF